MLIKHLFFYFPYSIQYNYIPVISSSFPRTSINTSENTTLRILMHVISLFWLDDREKEVNCTVILVYYIFYRILFLIQSLNFISNSFLLYSISRAYSYLIPIWISRYMQTLTRFYESFWNDVYFWTHMNILHCFHFLFFFCIVCSKNNGFYSWSHKVPSPRSTSFYWCTWRSGIFSSFLQFIIITMYRFDW